MLTLDLMKEIELQAVPWGQIATAAGFLLPNYNIPGRRVRIEVDGIENLPRAGRVILAMNHTDRYNYWPLQYTLWRRTPSTYTVTWVKGKYFNSDWMARFMVATNNIPTPSRGYLITVDATRAMGVAPSSELYRIVRDELDAPDRSVERARERAEACERLADLERLLETPRDMLGVPFDPRRQTYFEAMDQLFREMMDEFIRLNARAFALGHKVIVFPEGTRSLRLAKGRPGLAQMALRMEATVVPIGCNGSDSIYPGDSPVARPGRVLYRIGEPLEPAGALAPFQIDEPFVPFTKAAERAHGAAFEGMTSLLMERILELLDPRYHPRDGAATAVDGNARFL